MTANYHKHTKRYFSIALKGLWETTFQGSSPGLGSLGGI